jgi:hypothetical protein
MVVEHRWYEDVDDQRRYKKGKAHEKPVFKKQVIPCGPGVFEELRDHTAYDTAADVKRDTADQQDGAGQKGAGQDATGFSADIETGKPGLNQVGE